VASDLLTTVALWHLGSHSNGTNFGLPSCHLRVCRRHYCLDDSVPDSCLAFRTCCGLSDDSIKPIPLDVDLLKLCALAIAAGYGLQDLAHYLCVEKTMMSSYITTNPSMLLIHSLWLMPLFVIDAVKKMRSFFLPNVAPRNRLSALKEF
jgi:hypothetical protein